MKSKTPNQIREAVRKEMRAKHEWEPYIAGMFICRKCSKIASDMETCGM